MIQDVLTAIPLGIFLSFLIGPVFFVLLETSAVKGVRAALAFDFGVILADILFIVIAYGSSYRLILSIKNDPAVFLFGGGIMVFYGLISFLKHQKAGRRVDTDVVAEVIKNNYRGLFFKGFFLNFINVGVLLFWFLVLITIGPKLNLDLSRMITFFGSVIATYLVVDVFKILLAKQLKSKMTPNNVLKIKKLISILLIIFGVVIMAQGYFPSEQKLVKRALEKMD
ncbi:MAG TPA: LysE family transporter [Flavobacterium sp.]|jgi:threonine/homoserine/homoserine lactone efflux protein